jgi:hypothetical protein
MDWHKQSDIAKEEGVCHTDEECRQGYAELDPVKKDAAIAFLKRKLHEVLPEIRKSIADDPEHWNAPYHLGWGMSVRNLLRQEKMGEEFFDVDNLDCIYRRLVSDAARF